MPNQPAMSDVNRQQIEQFLGTLNFLMDRSRVAYTDYLDSGKIFFHARILRQYNDRIRELIMANAYLLEDSLRKDCIALLRHLDVWTLCWDDLHNNLRPDVNQEFAFANSVTFPRDAAERIGEYLQQMLEKR
jgi:hypothetical protein